MVGTLGQGSKRTLVARSIAHVVAAVIAAGGAGALLGALGAPLPVTVAAVLLVVVSGAYLGAELGWWRLPVPQTGRQVPASWRYHFPPPVTGALYGALLAPGVGTRVAFPSYVAVLGAAAFGGSVAGGVAIIGVFGTTRAIAAVVLAAFGRARPTHNYMAWGYENGPFLHGLIIVVGTTFLGSAVGAASNVIG